MAAREQNRVAWSCYATARAVVCFPEGEKRCPNERGGCSNGGEGFPRSVLLLMLAVWSMVKTLARGCR